MENNKTKFDWTIIFTSLVCLLPIVGGLILWDKLPDPLPTTYGFNNEVTGLSPKWVTVFILPLCLFLCNFIIWISFKFTNKDTGKTLKNICLWIVPLIGIVVSSSLYIKGMGADFEMTTVVYILLSLLFIILGNYLPKCRQNFVVGFRAPWTMENEEVWNKTHRFSGFFMLITGIVMLIGTFTPAKNIIFIAGIILVVIVPLIYSLIIADKYQKNKN